MILITTGGLVNMELPKFLYCVTSNKTHNIYKILGIKFKIKKGRLETKIKRKEKKYDVGIISFNMHSATYNFGAALHTYAFQKYLNKNNVNNVIINYYPETTRLNFITEKIRNNFRSRDFSTLQQNLIYAQHVLRKKIKFSNFFKKHCIVTKYRYEIDTLEQLTSINRFVCETDITWAKFKIGGYDKGFLCDLPNMKHKDNVAYSVDFGYGNLTGSNAANLKKYSKNFKYISVRNVLKVEDFKKAIERDDVEVTIDPVFLLDVEDYKVISKKPKEMKKDYVLVYNCADNNLYMREQAEKFAKERNLELIEINSYSRNIVTFEDSLPTPIGIEEFLGLIENCKYFFTNSYHGICFGIIFERQFYVYSRIFESEKLFVLLELFNLHNRFVAEGDSPSDENIDYKQVNNKLEGLLEKSKDFISKSIIEVKKENV